MSIRRAFLIVVLAALPAHAQTTEPSDAPAADVDTENAREAFVRATSLAKQSRWRDALDEFERSARLRAHPTTAYNVAYCERALGHHARAWVMFGRALEGAAPNGALPNDLADSARIYRGELESKLARVVVRLPTGATLTVDDRPLVEVTQGVWSIGDAGSDSSKASRPASFELVLDPGPHTFVLRLDRTLRVERALVRGDNGTLALELERKAPSPKPGARPVSAKFAQSPADDRPASYAAPIAAYGIGAAGVAVGAFFGLRALEGERELSETCPDKACSSRHRDDLDRAKTDARISTIGFAVGVTGAAVGTYLLLSVDCGKKRDVAPAIGLGWAGARGRF